MGDGRKLLMLLSIGSIFGLATLSFFSSNIQPLEVRISELNEDYLGKHVKVSGIVSRINQSKGHLFLSIFDDEEIQIPIFSDKYRVLREGGFEPNIGEYIEVCGTVDMYRGHLQILINSTEDINKHDVIYGIVESGKIVVNGRIFEINSLKPGFHGFTGKIIGNELIVEKNIDVEISESLEIGNFVEVEGRVSKVTEHRQVLETEIFMISHPLLGGEIFRVSDFVKVYGIVGEVEGYVGIIPLHVTCKEVEDSTSDVKKYEDYYPVRIKGLILESRKIDGKFIRAAKRIAGRI